MKSAKYLVLSVSVIALASCAAVPVTDKNLPFSDISTSWSASDKASADVQDGWLNNLHMASLSDFVGEVLKNNPDFRATAHRMEAAGYNVRVTRGNTYPSLNASVGVSRRSIQNPFIPSNNVSTGLNARWELDIWGRLASQTSASQANYVAAQYDLDGARLSLASQVAQAWFDAMEAESQAALAAKTVESYERAVRVVEKRFARGLSTGLDLRLVISNTEAARATLSSRKNQLSQQKRRLEILAGRYPAATIMASGELPDIGADVPVGLPVNLLERRPDLQAAKARLLAAGYNSQVAGKSLLPSFSITASGNNSSQGFSDILQLDNIFWNVLGNLTQPIFQGGKLRYTAKASKEQFEAEKQVFTKILLAAFKEVEDALSSERALREQVEFTAKAAENAVEAERVALDQYGRGLIKISTLLTSQRQSLAQQSQLLSVKKQLINNRIALHLALGGDFTTEQNNKAQQTSDQNSVAESDEGTSL
ncbi:MAG: efflux transporter outer membrane subunit [Alphaproteobacteria bacterium]|nr:efflux transporter outer membrane subunit [Alphaproteobacteria bacterium]